MTAQSVLTLIAAILGLVAVIGLGYFAWKQALTKIQSEAMRVQAEVIDAYERRIKQLEDAHEADSNEMKQMRREMDALKSELKGQRDLAKAIIETIAESRVCLVAPECDDRVVPTA